MKTKADRRQQFMRQYEEATVQAGIYEAGRVDWDTATFFFLSGKTVDEAVEQLKSHRR